MRIHLIAIGGAIMHNLAIALQKSGHIVTGSDDVIYDPAKSRLEQHELLPEKFGWYASNIKDDIDLVILGMHAKIENPELARALELNLTIQSFPEFIAQESIDKERIVIGGSHGKTTTTSMIMHVLNSLKWDIDYLVGAQLEDFSEMVRISDAPRIIIEGDEYLTSALDRKPKFLHYKPHIAVLTGIAWDHVNVFPDYDEYVRQFEKFIYTICEDGYLVYDATDVTLTALVNKINRSDITKIPYQGIEQIDDEENVEVKIGNERAFVNVFGAHNLKNMDAAYQVCKILGIADSQFAENITSFTGAAKRFQLLGENKLKKQSIYLDFAHAPSKVRASATAIKNKFSNRKVIICIELHTYSSLSKNFLPHYAGTMEGVNSVIVYYNPHAVKIKQLTEINPVDIYNAFQKPNLKVTTEKTEVLKFINNEWQENAVLVFMSSANFGGIDYKSLASELLDYSEI